MTKQRAFAIGSALMAVSTILSSEYVRAQFQAQVKNLSNTETAVDCTEVSSYGPNEGWYTSTRTIRRAGEFLCTGTECASNTYQLLYEREDASHAWGGRCETVMKPAVKGDGVMTIEVMFDSSITDTDNDGVHDDPGTAVYTLAAISCYPSLFDHDPVLASGCPHSRQEYTNANVAEDRVETDFFIANIKSNGIVAFGSPVAQGLPLNLPGFEVELYRIRNKWITIKIVRLNGKCSLDIEGAAGGTIHFPNSDAYLTPKANRQAWLKANPGGSWQGQRVAQDHEVECRLGNFADDPAYIIVNARAADNKCSIEDPLADSSLLKVRKVYWDAN